MLDRCQHWGPCGVGARCVHLQCCAVVMMPPQRLSVGCMHTGSCPQQALRRSPRLPELWCTSAGERRRGLCTLQYAPPEVVQAPAADRQPHASAAGDMWALGAIFQKILAAPTQMGECFQLDLSDADAIVAGSAAAQWTALATAVASEQETWVSR